jgi:hypothetical protein
MESARDNIRRIIFAITSILVVALAIRFVLTILTAASGHFLTQIVFDITDPLVWPFAGMFGAASLGIIGAVMEISVTLIFYIFIGIFLASIINSFLQDDFGKVILEIIDTLFKLLEFILIARLVLRLFGIAATTPFVAFIYTNTNWVGGLLPTYDILGGVLEFSTLFILVVVVIIDVIMEGMVEGMQKNAKPKSEGSTKVMAPQTTVIRERVQRVAPAQPQNITINIPMQQPVAQPRPAQPQVINLLPPRQ